MSAENFIFLFLLLKLTEVDVYPGICKEVFIYTDSWIDVTSVNFNSKKIHEDEIFCRQDILQFFSGEFKITNRASPTKRAMGVPRIETVSKETFFFLTRLERLIYMLIKHITCKLVAFMNRVYRKDL